jgi:hypothetical protein
MARRSNRTKKAGVIRLYGNQKPQPKPGPPPREREPRKAAKPPSLVRSNGVPAPFKLPHPHEAEPAPHNRNGAGQAKYLNLYPASRLCRCDKPLVFMDQEISRFDVGIENRCLRCGKPQGPANETDNNSQPLLPDDAA